MQAHFRRPLALAMFLTTISVSLAAGAPAGQAGPDAPSSPHEGARVHVVATPPRPDVKGRLVGLDDESIRLMVEGFVLEMSLEDVRRVDVEERDSLKNGFWIGALVVGAWCAAVCGQGLNSSSQLLPAIAVTASVGGLVGARIDASRFKRTRIYP
jgi:hypothetical protein